MTDPVLSMVQLSTISMNLKLKLVHQKTKMDNKMMIILPFLIGDHLLVVEIIIMETYHLIVPQVRAEIILGKTIE